MMQLLKRTFRDHLTYGIYTIAIVSTLMLYQKSATENRMLVVQTHSNEIDCYPKEKPFKETYAIALRTVPDAIASVQISQQLSKYTEKLSRFNFVTVEKMTEDQSFFPEMEKKIPYSNFNSCRQSNNNKAIGARLISSNRRAS